MDLQEQFYIIVEKGNNNEKLAFWKQHKDDLELWQQIDLIKGIHNDKLKLEFLEQNQEGMQRGNMMRLLIDSIDDDEIRLYCAENYSSLWHIIETVETINNDKIKQNFLEKYSKLEQSAVIRIITTFKNDKIKLDFLDNNPNIKDNDKYALLATLSFKTLSKIYSKNKYGIQDLVPLKYILLRAESNVAVFKFVNNNLEKFSGKVLRSIKESDTKLIESVMIALEENYNKLNSEQAAFLILNVEPKKQEGYYRRYKNKLDNINKYAILTTLKQVEGNEKKCNKHLKNIKLSNKEMVDKIIENFKCSSFDINAVSLLSPQGIECFGENNIYQMFKYGAYPETLPDISKAIKNPKLFKKFQELKRHDKQQHAFEVENIKNALIEFNQYYDLIKDCMKGEISEQEYAILVSAWNDKNIEITSKKDLLNYPTKRSEYIDQLMSENEYDAIKYILNKYFDLNDSQLSITNDFSEELQCDFERMRIIDEIMEIFRTQSREGRIKIIEAFKKDLEQEFTTKGSVIAELRNTYPGFEEKVANLYRKEFKESLSATQLPDAKTLENGDYVIELNGEPFKMLIHGLSAIDSNFHDRDLEKFYQNRDVGKQYVCTSLISNNHLGYAEGVVHYGFINISNSSVALEGNKDIGSSADENSLNIKSIIAAAKPHETTDQLIKNSHSYNEVVLYRDKVNEDGTIEPLWPDFVVAFDEITDKHREAVKDLEQKKGVRVPIVLINTKIYEAQIKQKQENEQKQTVENAQENVQGNAQQAISTEAVMLREEMLKIIEQSKNNCTARQQEAIMDEMQKEFKAQKEHTGGLNV